MVWNVECITMDVTGKHRAFSCVFSVFHQSRVHISNLLGIVSHKTDVNLFDHQPKYKAPNTHQQSQRKRILFVRFGNRIKYYVHTTTDETIR